MGTIPDYMPPQVSHSTALQMVMPPHQDQLAVILDHDRWIENQNNRYRNFIRENLKLDTTAVSSPLKGKAVVKRTVANTVPPHNPKGGYSTSNPKRKGLNLL